MPRPPDHVVEQIFDTIIQQRDVQSQSGMSEMAAWPIEKKWQLVRSHQIVAEHNKSGDDTYKGRGKKEKPEYYLSKFLDGTITVKLVASLNVGLRTYEIPYVFFSLSCLVKSR
jgi:hypothetical protein